jgi:hypothetical protein
MGPDAIINWRDYEAWAIILTIVGGLFWIVMYVLIIRGIVREKYVEMPLFAACGNFAWEFIWSWIYADRVTLGQLFVWSYRIWFILDIFIFISLLRYGAKQIAIPELKARWHMVAPALVLLWGAFIWTFVADDKDSLWGAPTAYMLNIFISGLFILLFLRQRAERDFSRVLAWCKFIGTTAYSVAYLSFQPNEPNLRALCVIIFVLDVTYLSLLHFYRHERFQQQAPTVKA